MPIVTQVIPIPLGSGIETGAHAWKAAPPAAVALSNLDVRKTGSYTKRTGYAQKYALSGQEGSDILISQKSALLVLNDHETRIFTGDATSRVQDFGGAVPVNVRSHSVAAFRGVLTNANIARNGTEIAVIVSETGRDGVEAANATMFILDSNFQVVWGPYRAKEIQHTPRVEPLGTGFLFMGAASSSGVALSAVFGSLAGGAPAAAFSLGINAAGPVPDKGETIRWDSHAVSGGTQVFVVSGSGSSGNFQIDTVSIDTALVVKKETPATGLGGTTKFNVTIWHSPSDNAVLIGADNTDKIWYHSDTYIHLATGGWTQVSTGVSSEALCFYEDGSTLYLNSRPITISTGPLSVSVGSAFASFAGIYHRRPQPSGGGGAYFFSRYTEVTERDADPARLQSGGTLGSDRMVRGGEELCFKENATVDMGASGGAITALKTVCVLQKGRKDLWYYDHLHTIWTGPSGTRTYTSGGAIGQSCKRDNTIFVPHIIVNKNYIQPPYWTDKYRTIEELEDPTTSDPQANFALTARDGGAGDQEGVTQLVISEIRLNTPTHSSLPLFGSTLIASGGLSVFDGRQNLPAYIDAPITIVIDENESAVALQDSSPYRKLGLKDNSAVELRAVFFAIDASGIKYRSAPFDLGIIHNETGANKYYEPTWKVTLPSFNNNNFLWVSRRLSVEIYITEVYLPASASPPSAYTLVSRSSVFWVSPEFYFGTSIPADGVITEGHRVQNPTSGYWEVELEAQPPPCTNIIAHAGKYIFAVRSEDTHTIAVSKPLVAFLGPEFNSILEIPSPASGGGVVSLVASGDRLTVLCENGTWDLFVGVGPDASGTGSFPDYRQIRLGDGCIDHNTTVATPVGIFYVAKSGPKLVTAAGELIDIGRAVRGSFLTSGINSVIYDAVREEIIVFRAASSDIYDIASGDWTTTTIGARSSVVQNDVVWRVDATGSNLRKKDSSTSDGSTGWLLAEYVSPWIKLRSPMDFARIHRVGVLIERTAGTKGNIIVKLAYDYTDTDIDTFTYAFSTFSILSKKIQLRVKPTRQKCDSIRITVTESTEGAGQNEANDLLWSLVSIDLEAGSKQGIIKLESGASL